MKREVERKRKIPAFSIGIGELEVLWGRAVALFDDTEKVHGRIEITLPTEKLLFKDIEELKQYSNLKGRITKFSLLLYQGDRDVYIRSGDPSSSQAIVSATGEAEAWCAGAIETVYSFLQSYKVWYHRFVAAPIGWVLILLFNIPPTIGMLFLLKGTTIDRTAFLGWLAALIALAFLYVLREKLFPAAALRITEEESYIHRHSAELGLIIALLSAVLSAVGWFLGK
jgi:hypothetical protein